MGRDPVVGRADEMVLKGHRGNMYLDQHRKESHRKQVATRPQETREDSSQLQEEKTTRRED